MSAKSEMLLSCMSAVVVHEREERESHHVTHDYQGLAHTAGKWQMGGDGRRLKGGVGEAV